MEPRIARASVVIGAPRALVWSVLMAPETILRIMPVDEVTLPWRAGEPFAWTFQLADRPSRVDGVVVRLEDASLLEYDYVDPHSRDVLNRHETHRVRIELEDEAEGTRVRISQEGNEGGPVQHAHAEGGWRLVLANLRVVVESRLAG